MLASFAKPPPAAPAQAPMLHTQSEGAPLLARETSLASQRERRQSKAKPQDEVDEGLPDTVSRAQSEKSGVKQKRSSSKGTGRASTSKGSRKQSTSNSFTFSGDESDLDVSVVSMGGISRDSSMISQAEHQKSIQAMQKQMKDLQKQMEQLKKGNKAETTG